MGWGLERTSTDIGIGWSCNLIGDKRLKCLMVSYLVVYWILLDERLAFTLEGNMDMI